MKKKLLICLAIIINIHPYNAIANEKLAIVNIYNIFQKFAQKNTILNKLEQEFKHRINELKNIEYNLQHQIQNFKHTNSKINHKEKNEIEKFFIKQKEIFNKKIEILEKDKIKREIEEKNKFLKYIQIIISKIAIKNHLDIVIDSNSVLYTNKNTKNITNEILKEINNT
ncbi:MAG: periplasmic chaperone Skp [Candidatus Westeberhardia cardiocondylae]|nr:periplasmic chaperone Skp [Candidatus Westeberhardia cardiocondylae]